MPETPLGFLSYGEEGSTSWYEDDGDGVMGLVEWLTNVELLGIPTYANFDDLPDPMDTETNGYQQQFVAVVGDRTVYRASGFDWDPWFGEGTSDRPIDSAYIDEIFSNYCSIQDASINVGSITDANIDQGSVTTAPSSSDDIVRLTDLDSRESDILDQMPETYWELQSGDSILSDDTPSGTESVQILGSANTDYPSVAIGDGASASGGNDGPVAIGPNASATGWGATAVGFDTTAPDDGAVAIGHAATADTGRAHAIGYYSYASGFHAVGLGAAATAENAYEGVLGDDSDGTGTTSWVVPGDFTVQGSKDFVIDHPSKPETHDLRHGAYEGPVPGGLIYNDTVEVTDGEGIIDLPEYVANGDFGRNWTCHVTPADHFGTGYVDEDEWAVVADTDGAYEVTIFGERDDDAALANGRDRTEKPKGERWGGSPRTYWRDCPRFDPEDPDSDRDADDIVRIEEKYSHTEDCPATPCTEAFAEWRVTFDDGERVRVEAESCGCDASLDAVRAAACDRSKIARTQS